MVFRRFWVVFTVGAIVSALAGPATAQPCLLGLLCSPSTLPPEAPSPPSPQIPTTPALPSTEPVTRPVTDAVNSVAESGVTGLEAEMLSLVNAARVSAGVPALGVSNWAQSFARAFSEKMMAAGSIWHNPEYFAKGRSAMGADLLSENVAYDSSVAANHLGLMKSPNHRANILDGRLTHVGIGIAVSSAGRIYVTQDFARIPGSRAARQNPSRTAGTEKGSSEPSVLAARHDPADQGLAEVPTISLAAGAPKQTENTGMGGPAPVAALPSKHSQSPAPMIPGLVSGGILAFLAPLLMAAKKLLITLRS